MPSSSFLQAIKLQWQHLYDYTPATDEEWSLYDRWLGGSCIICMGLAFCFLAFAHTFFVVVPQVVSLANYNQRHLPPAQFTYLSTSCFLEMFLLHIDEY